ncbi:hypothetical protein R6Q59_004243 [Mikania micrantha]
MNDVRKLRMQGRWIMEVAIRFGCGGGCTAGKTHQRYEFSSPELCHLKIISTATSSVAAFLHRRPFSSDDTTTITVETNVPFTGQKCEPPSRSVDTFFTDMAPMRRQEIAIGLLYKSKVVQGFYHLYEMQEVVSIGMGAAITKKDCIITAYAERMGRQVSLWCGLEFTEV